MQAFFPAPVNFGLMLPGQQQQQWNEWLAGLSVQQSMLAASGLACAAQPFPFTAQPIPSPEEAAPADPGCSARSNKKISSQARNRERIKDMEDQVAEKLAELQVLQAENEALQLRHRVLEGAVALREQHLLVLQQHGPPRSIIGEGAAADVASAAATAATAATTARPGPCGEAPCHCAERAEQEAAEAEAAAAVAAEARGGVTAADVAQAQARLARSCKAMSADTLRARCRSYMQAAWGLLVRLERNPADADAAARLEQQTLKLHAVMSLTALLNPGCIYQAHLVDMDGQPCRGPPSDQHWGAVVQALELDATQKALCVASYQLYLGSAGRGLALQQQLGGRQLGLGAGEQPVPGAAAPATSGSGSGSGSEGGGAQDPPGINRDICLCSVVDQLAGNFSREHVAMLMLDAFFWGKVLTWRQHARAVVQSYPYLPDGASMVRLVVASCDSDPRFGHAKQAFGDRWAGAGPEHCNRDLQH